MLSLCRIALLFAALLFAGSAWLIFSPVTTTDVQRTVLNIIQPPTNLGELAVGSHELPIAMSSRGGRNTRVVGMQTGCRPNVCFNPKATEPLVIPAGGTGTYICELHITGIGPFECPILLYLDDGGLREAHFTVRGVGVAAK